MLYQLSYVRALPAILAGEHRSARPPERARKPTEGQPPHSRPSVSCES